MPRRQYHEALPPVHTPTERESSFREDHLSAIEVGRRAVIELDNKLEQGASKLLQESIWHYEVDILKSITENQNRRDSQFDVDRKTLVMFDNAFNKQASEVAARERWSGVKKVKDGLVKGDLVAKEMRGLPIGTKPFEKYPAITHQIVKDKDPKKLDKYLEITFREEPKGPDDGRRVFRFSPEEMRQALTDVGAKASSTPPIPRYEKERMFDNNVSTLLVIRQAMVNSAPAGTPVPPEAGQIWTLITSYGASPPVDMRREADVDNIIFDNDKNRDHLYRRNISGSLPPPTVPPSDLPRGVLEDIEYHQKELRLKPSDYGVGPDKIPPPSWSPNRKLKLEKEQAKLNRRTKWLSLACRVMLSSHGMGFFDRKFYNYQVDKYKKQAEAVFKDKYEQGLVECLKPGNIGLDSLGEEYFKKTPESVALDILVDQESELSKYIRHDFTRARMFNLLPQDQFINGATPASIVGELGRVKLEDVQQLLGRQNAATMAIVMSEMLMQNTDEELAPIDSSRVKCIRTLNGFWSRRLGGAKMVVKDVQDNVDTAVHANNVFSSTLEEKEPARPPMFKLPAKEKMLMLPTETVEELVGKVLYYLPKGRMDKAVEKLQGEMLKRGDVYAEDPEGPTDKSSAKYRFTSNMEEDSKNPSAQPRPPKPLPKYARDILQRELTRYWNYLYT
jgi:hypothetical protein